MDDDDKRNALISAISHEESHLAELDKERYKILAELKSLKAELSILTDFPLDSTKDTPLSSDGIISKISSPEEKIALFRSLFRGEGFDDARVDTLFLAMPVSWKGTLVQYAGRIHRLHEGKKDVRIYDYVDSNVPMLMNMFKKRLKGYRTLGYEW